MVMRKMSWISLKVLIIMSRETRLRALILCERTKIEWRKKKKYSRNRHARRTNDNCRGFNKRYETSVSKLSAGLKIWADVFVVENWHQFSHEFKYCGEGMEIPTRVGNLTVGSENFLFYSTRLVEIYVCQFIFILCMLISRFIACNSRQKNY